MPQTCTRSQRARQQHGTSSSLTRAVGSPSVGHTLLPHARRCDDNAQYQRELVGVSSLDQSDIVQRSWRLTGVTKLCRFCDQLHYLCSDLCYDVSCSWRKSCSLKTPEVLHKILGLTCLLEWPSSHLSAQSLCHRPSTKQHRILIQFQLWHRIVNGINIQHICFDQGNINTNILQLADNAAASLSGGRDEPVAKCCTTDADMANCRSFQRFSLSATSELNSESHACNI